MFKDGSQVLPEKQASKVGVEKTRQKGSSQSYNYLNTYSQRKVLLAHSERNYYCQIVLLAETPSEMYYWVQCDVFLLMSLNSDSAMHILTQNWKKIFASHKFFNSDPGKNTLMDLLGMSDLFLTSSTLMHPFACVLFQDVCCFQCVNICKHENI